jgi:hypothetical protein
MRIPTKSLFALALIANVPAFAGEPPPARVGRVSYVTGTLAFYGPGDADWSAARVNLPVATGGWFATDPQSRAEIRIGAETIDLAGSTQIGITDLNDGIRQIALTQGRLDLNLRQLDSNDSAEVDIPRGGVWLLQAGIYDIDSGTADRPARIMVFVGSARFAGGGADMTIKAGEAAVLSGADVVSATVEQAAADNFVEWCRSRDYQEQRLAASHHVSPAMTGFEELDGYGGWATVPQYGTVWYPNSLPADWVPYRNGEWVSMAPWGWTWVDAEPWGFAPFHYGRWAYIDDRWGWVPGNFVPRPVYAPALVAFIENVGVVTPAGAGRPVGWFPLAPGEIYWPNYTRNPAYISNVNIANVSTTTINEVTRVVRTQRFAAPPPLVTNQQFANRRAAIVVPANTFASSASVAPAALPVSPQAIQQARIGLRPPQLVPAAARPAPITLPLPRQAGPASAPAAPTNPPNFGALSPAPSGPRGHAVIAQQPGRAAPRALPIGQPPAPPSFSHLAPAGSHGLPPAAQSLHQPPQTQAMPDHPPVAPHLPHVAPATMPPPPQAVHGGPVHATPAPQVPPRPGQGAVERSAQQHSAAEQQTMRAAAERQAHERAAAQAAAQQRAAAQAAAQAQPQHSAAQQHGVAQQAPPPHEAQGHGNCGHPGQPACPR